MDTNTQKKEETKAENAKKEEKFDFKAEAKRWWAAFVAFVKPYKDLNKKPLSGAVGPALKKNINMIYTVGYFLLAFCAIYTLIFTPGLWAKFSGLVGVLIFFLLFRLTCELISKKD